MSSADAIGAGSVGDKRELHRQMTPVVRLLTHDDDNVRRRAISYLRTEAPRWLVAAAVERLMSALKGPERPSRLQAAASLADIGEPALAALKHTLLTARDPAFLVRVIRVLSAIGRIDSLRQQLEVQAALLIALRRTHDESVANAAAEAIAGR